MIVLETGYYENLYVDLTYFIRFWGPFKLFFFLNKQKVVIKDGRITQAELLNKMNERLGNEQRIRFVRYGHFVFSFSFFCFYTLSSRSIDIFISQ